MATNHTENYNLNLWEANDKFVREEFNENTNKIDAALTNKLGRGTLLKTEVCPANSLNYTLSFDGINWDKWEYVVIHCDLIGPSSQDIGFEMVGQSQYGTTAPQVPFIVVLFPRHDGSRMIEFLFLSYNVIIRHLNVSYAGCPGFRIGSNSRLPESTLTVYGI